jgi:uncharacterized phage infection (PIP) family protein YhgE
MRTVKDFNKETIVTDIKVDLQKKLNEGVQKIEATVNVTLEEKLKGLQLVTNVKIKNLSEKLQQAHTGLSEKTQQAQTVLAENLDKTHTLVAGTVERLSEITKNINHVNSEMADQINSLTEGAEQLLQRVNPLEDFAKKSATSIENLEHKVDSLETEKLLALEKAVKFVKNKANKALHSLEESKVNIKLPVRG